MCYVHEPKSVLRRKSTDIECSRLKMLFSQTVFLVFQLTHIFLKDSLTWTEISLGED